MSNDHRIARHVRHSDQYIARHRAVVLQVFAVKPFQAVDSKSSKAVDAFQVNERLATGVHKLGARITPTSEDIR